ncbi:MAG TPA: PKD domain-containing protein [Miltoncostaeaceae bacterium]|nr:PKD domain-containing protein [Miltoncostaeaceae bacterium]
MRAVRAALAALALAVAASAAHAAPAPPDVTGGSSAWTDAATVRLTATGGGPGVAGYEHRVSPDAGATWLAPAAGDTVDVGLDGEVWVQFRAVDGLGAVSAWAPPHAGAPDPSGLVRIDRFAPDVPATPAAATPTAAAPALAWTASTDTGGAGIAGYRVERGGALVATPATAAFTDAGAPEGVHVYRIRAVDHAGNVSLPSAPREVVVDTTPPSPPQVTGGADVPRALSAVTVTATGAADALSGPPAYQWRTSRDGGATWSAPGAGASREVSEEGTTLVQFRAVDGAGNASGWRPAHAPGAPDPAGTVTLDRTPPATPGAPSGGRHPVVLRWSPTAGADLHAVLRDGVEVARTAADGLTDVEAVDLAAPAAPGVPRAVVPVRGRVLLRWAPVADLGTPYRYRLRARDRAGNSSPDGPEALLRAEAGVAVYEVRADDRVVAEVSAPVARLDGLDPERTYAFTVRARDAAGNGSGPSPTLGVRPQPGPLPWLALETSRDALRPGDPLVLRARVDGVAAGPVRWDLGDGGAAQGPVVVHRYAGTGTYTVSAAVPAADGRLVRVRRAVVVDAAPPRLRLRITGNRLRVPAADDLSGVAGVVLAGPPARAVGPDGVLLPDGPQRVRLIAHDRAGNRTELESDVVVDGTRPRLRVTAPAAAAAARVAAEVSTGDATTGVVRLEIDGRPLSPDALQPVPLTTGRWHVLTAWDGRGNRARVRVRVLRVHPAPARHAGLEGARRDQLRYDGREPALRGVRARLAREVQVRLTALGLLPPGHRPDGRFRLPVLRAVQAYQRRAGLPVLGTVGPRTRAALAGDTARPRVRASG